ncbi:MAG: nuclear export factor [Solirubrobacterales bacterium]|nr:nuclear export factor [Solirubrobacterales bacterium]
MNMKHLVLAATAATITAPATADAHVTLQPKTAPAGGYVVENVRVPNETDNATTTRVTVRLPPGFASVLYQADPGWKVNVTQQKLTTPIKTDDGEVTDEVRQITWIATSSQAGIKPGQFKDFPLSLQIPDKAGSTLTFKALQTYSDGNVVRWIGAGSSDTPAPTVDITKATTAPAATARAATTPSVQVIDKQQSKTLSIAALIIGALGLLAGTAALATRRKA